MGVTTLLTDLLTLLEPTRTGTGAGGWATTYESVGQVPGRVTAAPRRNDEQIEGGAPGVQQRYDILFDASTVKPTSKQRIRDGQENEYELVVLTVQDGIAICEGRRV